MIGTATRYALRSLRRNGRRSLLSIAGLAFGVGIGLIALSWMGGMDSMSLNAVARGGVGHLRVVPEGWNTTRDEAMRLVPDEGLLERVRALPGVELATPRARVGALLGMGTRSAHVGLTGVDPVTEPRSCLYVSELSEGRYLEPDERGAIVLGQAVLTRLDARLGDELVVSVVDAEGEMQSAILVVVGVVETGSRAIDMSIAQVTLADVEALSGREGYGEITVNASEPDDLGVLRAELSALAPAGDEVLSWMDVSDGLRMKIESGGVMINMAIAVILLVVLLGVASAQLTAVLERRKEFAVLAALGMRGVSLVRVLVTEGVALGVVGALLAIAWTSPLLYGWATDGVDLRSMIPSSEDGMAFSGVLIDTMYYPSFGFWVLPTALMLSLIATIVASLYPAWFASRTNPAEALRVDR